MYQDRLLGPVGNGVRFLAIGGRTATTEFRAQSCRCASLRLCGSFCQEQSLQAVAVNDRVWVDPSRY